MNTRIEFIRVFFIPLFFTHKVISFTDSPGLSDRNKRQAKQ